MITNIIMFLMKNSLKKGTSFYLKGDGTEETSYRRILFVYKNFIFIDKQTVGYYREDNSKNLDQIISEERELKECLYSDKKTFEDKLKKLGVNYDIVKKLNLKNIVISAEIKYLFSKKNLSEKNLSEKKILL